MRCVMKKRFLLGFVLVVLGMRSAPPAQARPAAVLRKSAPSRFPL